jgi:hypothetical protein
MSSELIEKIESDLKIESKEAFLKAVSLALLEKLDDNGRREYAKMAKEGADPEKLEGFLREKISEFDQIAEDIAADFK